MLAADFANLAASVVPVAAVSDRLHVDVMDGHFVPNLTFGPPVIAALRKHTDIYFDTHLMITNPGALLEDYVRAGANGITFHVELGDPRPLIDRIRAQGLDVGLSVSPETPFEVVEPYLELLDTLLIMSVHPGFGGQAFIPEVLSKVEAARRIIDDRNLSVLVEVDGGITIDTAVPAGAAGADILVAGSAVFKADDPIAAVGAIREAGATARARGAVTGV